MTIKEAIEQLESLRQSSMASIDKDDPEDVFAADVKALDIAIESIKKAALLEQETAQKETNIHEQYTSAEEEIQEQIFDLLRYCLKAKKIGVDCFFYYSPHVGRISVEIYINGWKNQQNPNISLGVYTDEDSRLVMEQLKICNDSLRKVIGDRFRAILNREI